MKRVNPLKEEVIKTYYGYAMEHPKVFKEMKIVNRFSFMENEDSFSIRIRLGKSMKYSNYILEEWKKMFKASTYCIYMRNEDLYVEFY